MSLGLLSPTEKVYRPFRQPLEVYRCMTDGGLLTMSLSSISQHAGHSVKQPVLLKLHEVAMIWLGIIK